jgi:hypothetical protein
MFSFMCRLHWIPHNKLTTIIKNLDRPVLPTYLSTWRPVKHLAPPPFNSRSGRSRKSTRSQSQAETRRPRNDECPPMPVCVVVISLGCDGLVVSCVVVSCACWTHRRLRQWQWMGVVSRAMQPSLHKWCSCQTLWASAAVSSVAASVHPSVLASASVSSTTASSQAPNKSRPHLHTCDQTHASGYDSHQRDCGKARSDRASFPSISMVTRHQESSD